MLPEPSNIPPSKANLKAWWNHFTSVPKSKKETNMGTDSHRTSVSRSTQSPLDTTGPPVFGKPLEDCLKYASVQISTVDAKGERYVWGYIPIVVAKWYVLHNLLTHGLLMTASFSNSGLYLKDNGRYLRFYTRHLIQLFLSQQPK